jgi:integrase/recombinase XerD
MTPSSVPAAALVQAFFVDYLLNQKHASPRTVAAYRDAFRLLLGFVRETHGVEPAVLSIENLDVPMILAFLDHIEQQRANSIRSRNARLAAIRSFFRFVQMREPAAVAVASRVLAIPVKRTERKLIGYLTRPEIDALLSATDRTNWDGRRDHALLLTLYNSGARVSEIIGVCRDDIVLDAPASLKLHGKECHSYCISLRPRHETTGTHACRPACNLAFSLADVLLAVRKGTGLGPCTDAHGARRVEPMSEPYPA